MQNSIKRTDNVDRNCTENFTDYFTVNDTENVTEIILKCSSINCFKAKNVF